MFSKPAQTKSVWGNASTFALLIASLFVQSPPATGDNDLDSEFVVARKISGTSKIEPKQAVMLSTGEIVKRLEKKGSQVLVKRVENTTNTNDRVPFLGPLWEEWKTIEQGPVWIPRNAIAGRQDFKKINYWVPKKEDLVVCAAPCDAGMVYKIFSDGTFESTWETNTERDKSSGHLYQFKNLVWAREKAYSRFSSYTVMIVGPNSSLCHREDQHCLDNVMQTSPPN